MANSQRRVRLDACGDIVGFAKQRLCTCVTKVLQNFSAFQATDALTQFDCMLWQTGVCTLCTTSAPCCAARSLMQLAIASLTRTSESSNNCRQLDTMCCHPEASLWASNRSGGSHRHSAGHCKPSQPRQSFRTGSKAQERMAGLRSPPQRSAMQVFGASLLRWAVLRHASAARSR